MMILLVEDDAVLADGLVHALGRSDYCVKHAATGADAERRLPQQNFDLIVLDLGLPGMDGLGLLRRLRAENKRLPVLVLTARDGVKDRVEGIRQDADDYLAKPFELKELEARTHALLRRFALSGRGEYSVLEMLLTQAGKVVSKDRIGQRLAFEGAAQTDNAIDIYIHRLRKRIEPYLRRGDPDRAWLGLFAGDGSG